MSDMKIFKHAWKVYVRFGGVVYLDTVVLTVEHDSKEVVDNCYELQGRKVDEIKYLGNCCNPE